MAEFDPARLAAAAAAAKPEMAAPKFDPEKLRVAGQQDVNNALGASTGFINGFLWGGGDEVLAAVTAALGGSPDEQGRSRLFDYSAPIADRYDNALGNFRQVQDNFRDQNPAMAATSEIAGGVAGALVPAQKIGILGKGFGAAGKVGKTARLVGLGSIAGAVNGFLEGRGSGRLGSAGGGAVLGAVLSPLTYGGMQAASKALGAINDKAVVMLQRMGIKEGHLSETGEFTASGREFLRSKGLDPDRITKGLEGFYVRAARQAAAGADPAQVARAADLESLVGGGTLGQVTGNVLDQAQEFAMAAGARGRSAQEIMGQKFNEQKEVLAAGLSNRFGGDVNIYDAAEGVIGAVPALAEKARAAGSQAYKTLESMGAMAKGAPFGRLGQKVQNFARMDGVHISQEITPNSFGAISAIDALTERFPKGAVPFTEVERVRQNLGTYYRAAQRGTGADQMAMAHVMREFDDGVEGIFKKALISGDQGALAQAKEARDLWSKYLNTFRSKDGIDRHILALADEKATPDEVVRWFVGLGNNVGGGQTSRAALRLRDVLGKESQEWQDMRAATWSMLTDAGQDKLTDRAAAISKRLQSFTTGKGRALGQVMFTKDEMAEMVDLRRRLDLLVANPDAINRSGTAYEGARAMQGLVQNAAAAIGFSKGGMAGAVIAREGVKTTENVSAALRARLATQGRAVTDIRKYKPIYMAPYAATTVGTQQAVGMTEGR